MDSFAPHKHPKVNAWLAGRQRYHLDFTPTLSSSLNQVARWIGLISQRVIKRASLPNVTDLVNTIKTFTEGHNAHAMPVIWVATAQSIIDKVGRSSIRRFRFGTLGADGASELALYQEIELAA